MRDSGKYDQALEFLNRSLQIKEQALGTAHPSLELDFHNIGDVLRLQQKYEEAIPMFERALSFNETAMGKGHPNQIFHLTGMGQSYLGLHRPERAIPPLERALEISEKAKVEPAILGEARFALARALTELRREPNRARALAEQARQAFTIAGAESTKDLHEVNQWLAKKP
jgi:tetratricopeptide (TPR) repeat protein